MSKRGLLSLIFVAILVALPVAAQEEPVAGFEALVEVTEVLLDVLAIDRSGNVVTGLGKDDFIVVENGEPKDVTGVSFYATLYGAGGEPAPEAAVPSSRYFVFFFDDMTRDGLAGIQRKAARGAARWVAEEMEPSDWVAVVSYDVRLKIHQDFTQNRETILAGFHSAALNRNPEERLGEGGSLGAPPSGAPSLLRQLPRGKELSKKTKRIYDAVRLVAEAAGHIVGRKNLLLFSTGFGEMRPGFTVAGVDGRCYPRMEQALNDNNMAVYPVDLTLGSNPVQGYFLTRLANDTGGHYHRPLASFLLSLKRISRENSGYYLLSYQSEHPAAGAGYQEVKVKARDRSIKVRARRGYRFGSHSEG